MPNLIQRWLGRPPAAKAYRPPAAIGFVGAGRPVWSGRDYGALAREGYMRNAVAHRAVRLVAESAASVPLTLLDRRDILAEHPLLSLLARPNPRESGTRLLETLYAFLLVSGNAYAEALSIDGAVREIYALRPDAMTVEPGPEGWPEAYQYRAGSGSVRYPARAEDGGVRPILHLRLFHPLDDHYGLSPMSAAAGALDLHNAAGAWNKALLENAARPSGALVFGASGATLSGEQFERLKAELAEHYQGAANAGRPLLLEGGLDWRPLSLSPKDMDFMEAKNAAAREIALAFGVPPLLLGLAGDNTHANYAEANRALYRQTVLPLVRKTAEELLRWLVPDGEGMRLEPDLDAIEALADERESLWRRVTGADFLTADEKREAVGYGARGRA